MSPCSEYDKQLRSKRSLNDHFRKKHNVENKKAKSYQCGHCEISFTRSCNLLRLLGSQHQSTNSYRCFSCQTYLGSLASLSDHQELHHSKLPSTSVSFNNVCHLIDFSTEAVNSKFQFHRLKLENCGVLEPSNYLVSQKESPIHFVDCLLPNLKIGLIICVKLEKLLENETVDPFFKSVGRISRKISDDEYLQHMDALMTQFIVFATGGSGWVVKTLSRIEIKTVCCNNVSVISYIETPPLLKPLKRSFLNVVNKRDIFSFLYCIAAAMFFFTGESVCPNSHKKHREALFQPEAHSNDFIRSSLVRKRNHCSINVFQLKNTKLVSVYFTKNQRAGTKMIYYASWKTKTAIFV